jgi:hypothetical protein
MKYIFLLPIMAITFNSCFTSKLLSEETNVSAIPPDAYSYKRAYYSSDSILHIDFTNNYSHRRKTTYYGISLNINAILKAYYKNNEDIVYFKHKITRKYRATSARSILKNCTCIETYNDRNALLMDFDDIRVTYMRTLPLINDSTLIIKKADILDANCCTQPDIDDDDDYCVPINQPTTIYMMPIADTTIGFVALRFPLKSHKTKIAFLPLTFLLDAITSPIQLGVAILENKLNGNDDSNNYNETNKRNNSSTRKKNTDKNKKKEH